jgi:hypothetical protein
MDENKIITYQSDTISNQIDVIIEDEMVWLNIGTKLPFCLIEMLKQ